MQRPARRGGIITMLFNEYLIVLDKNKKVKSKYENAVTFNNELAGLITDALHRY